MISTAWLRRAAVGYLLRWALSQSSWRLLAAPGSGSVLRRLSPPLPFLSDHPGVQGLERLDGTRARASVTSVRGVETARAWMPECRPAGRQDVEPDGRPGQSCRLCWTGLLQAPSPLQLQLRVSLPLSLVTVVQLRFFMGPGSHAASSQGRCNSPGLAYGIVQPNILH